MALKQYYLTIKNLTLHPLEFFKGKLTDTEISRELGMYEDLNHVAAF